MKLSLSWNGFDQNISNPDDLKWISSDSGENLPDVFLITKNQQKIGAHRSVLRHGSKYFQDHVEKFISIDTMVRYEDLVTMLDFMYTGKCEVEVANLERFLASAKQLALVGLKQDTPEAADDINDKTEFNEEPIKSEPEAHDINNTIDII